MNQEEAKKAYSKLGSIPCPVLNDGPIACTNIGFNHLIRRGKNVRTIEDQERRLSLIPYIKTVIGNPHSLCVYEKRVAPSSGITHFWGLSRIISGKEITVVIRQVGENGRKHFFSIMDSRIKKTPGRESL